MAEAVEAFIALHPKQPPARPTGEWELTYRVPVLVTVDFDELVVTAVRVDDTEARYDPEASSHVSHAVENRAELAAWEAAAVAIAEAGEWPSWELGA